MNEEDTSIRKGTLFSGIADTWNDDLTLIAGRFLEQKDIVEKDSVMVLNKVIAQQLQKEENLDILIGYNL